MEPLWNLQVKIRYESAEFDAWKCGPHYRRSAEPNTSRALIEKLATAERIVLSDVFLDSLRQTDWLFKRIMRQIYWVVPAVHYLCLGVMLVMMHHGQDSYAVARTALALWQSNSYYSIYYNSTISGGASCFLCKFEQDKHMQTCRKWCWSVPEALRRTCDLVFRSQQAR